LFAGVGARNVKSTLTPISEGQGAREDEGEYLPGLAGIEAGVITNRKLVNKKSKEGREKGRDSARKKNWALSVGGSSK